MHMRQALATGCAVIAAFAVAAGIAPTAAAFDLVAIESKSVVPNAVGVEVGVVIANSYSMTSINLPFEIRTVSGGAYIASNFDFMRVPGGRADGAFDMMALDQEFPTPGVQTCSGPRSSTWDPPSSSVDFISPDAAGFFGIALAYPLPGGIDPSPSFKFVFDVNGSVGVFEIDTCCVTPDVHLMFYETGVGAVMPLFEKGVITVGYSADANCDGIVDVLDVVTAANQAFRGWPLTPPCE